MPDIQKVFFRYSLSLLKLCVCVRYGRGGGRETEREKQRDRDDPITIGGNRFERNWREISGDVLYLDLGRSYLDVFKW